MIKKYRVTEVLRGDNKTYYVPEYKYLLRWRSLLPMDDPGYSTINGAWNSVDRQIVLDKTYHYPTENNGE